jgi:hypothetical protein
MLPEICHFPQTRCSRANGVARAAPDFGCVEFTERTERMLPELTDRIATKARRMFAGFGSAPISLGLERKDAGDDWYMRETGSTARRRRATRPAGRPGAVKRSRATRRSIIPCVDLQADHRGVSRHAAAAHDAARRARQERSRQHPMYNALQNAPNDENHRAAFRETVTGHCVLGGYGYAQILRRSGTKVANELVMLLPEQVTPGS